MLKSQAKFIKISIFNINILLNSKSFFYDDLTQPITNLHLNTYIHLVQSEFDTYAMKYISTRVLLSKHEPCDRLSHHLGFIVAKSQSLWLGIFLGKLEIDWAVFEMAGEVIAVLLFIKFHYSIQPCLLIPGQTLFPKTEQLSVPWDKRRILLTN